MFGEPRGIEAHLEGRAPKRFPLGAVHARDIGKRGARLIGHVDLRREVKQSVECRGQSRIFCKTAAIDRRHGVLLREVEFGPSGHSRLGQAALVRAVLGFRQTSHEMEIGREFVRLREHGETLGAQAKQGRGIGDFRERRFGARTDIDGDDRRCAGFTHVACSRTARATRSGRVFHATAVM